MPPAKAKQPDLSIPLKEYFDARFDAIDKATTLAAEQMNKRLEGMNEIREAMREQAANFATCAEVNAKFALVDKDLRTLLDYKAELEGKASLTSVYVAWILAGAGLLVSIISIVMR